VSKPKSKRRKTSVPAAAPKKVRDRAPWTPPPWMLAVLIALIMVMLICTAWQSDDAFITFRTARNFWAGEGLCWNPGERVQSYSNPLWLLAALFCQGLFGEVYFSMLFVSLAIAGVNLWLVAFRFSGATWLSVLALIALSCSAAAVDYATSGLENGLLALLLLLFLDQMRREPSVARLVPSALLAALIALTRLDALLFALPALAVSLWPHRRRLAAWLRLALGFAPLAAWELFSLIYYGSLVPNTAYAKLNVAIPKTEMMAQGLAYFGDALTRDPMTLLLILGGVAAAWRWGEPRLRAASLGVALYLLYIVWIGGDFMAGRFLAAPAWAGAGLLTIALTPAVWRRLTASRSWLAPAVLAALALYGLAWPASRWGSGADYGAGLRFADIVGPAGIADERAYYYPSTGLLAVLAKGDEISRNGWPTPPYRAAISGRDFAASDQRAVVTDEVGFFGYFAGPDKSIIDIWALCDPLLARLPFQPEGEWRVGHYRRALPVGYRESYAAGENRFEDPDVAEFYDAIVAVTRGPLFTGERWRAIWRLHTGYFSEAIARAAATTES